MDYAYKINISGDRTLYFRELNLQEYKNLQKICIESDITIFKWFSLNMIKELCVEGDCSDLNLVDVYVILLYIRVYSISGEKEFNTYINEKRCVVKVNILDLISKVLDAYGKYLSNKYLKIDIKEFELAEQALVDVFNNNKIVGFVKDGVIYDGLCDEIDSLIPLFVKNQIDKQTISINRVFNNIELFKLNDKDGNENVFNFDIDETYIYTICKIIMKDDLKSLYQNFLDLKEHVNINFDEHKYMTLSEMGIYVNMFNKKQAELKSKQSQTNQYPI